MISAEKQEENWSNTLKLQKCKNTKAYRAKQVLGSSANQCTCNKNGGNKLRMRSLSRPQRYWHLAQQSKNYRRGQHCTHPPGTRSKNPTMLDDRCIIPSFDGLIIILIKSVHFKKPIARISFLSKLWYFLF